MKTQQRINTAIIWVGFFFMLSLAWTVMILPFLFIGLLMIIGHSQAVFNAGLVALIVAVPIFGFPASVAVMKVMLPFLKSKAHDHVWRRFFQAWRHEYRVSLAYGSMCTGILLIGGLCGAYYWQRFIPLAVLFMALTAVVLLAMVYGLPLVATRRNSAFSDIKNSVLLLMMHPVEAITSWLAVITVGMLGIKLVPVVLLLVAPAVWLGVWAWGYLKMTQRVALLNEATGDK